MVFSYTPKSDKYFVDHKVVVLISVVNGLDPEDLLKTKVFFVDYYYYLYNIVLNHYIVFYIIRGCIFVADKSSINSCQW